MSPRVEAILVYPVKALRGLAVQHGTVEPWGLAGDRRWMVVKPDGRFLTQRDRPELARIMVTILPGGVALARPAAAGIEIPTPGRQAPRRRIRIWSDELSALDAGPEAAAWLGAALGFACGLVYLDDTSARPVDPAYGRPEDRVAFPDGFPVLLTNEASLQAVNAALPQPVPMSRFRPNIVIAGAGAWAEDHWRRIRIGTVSFRVVKPCSRCIVTTVDQLTGTRPDQAEPLKTLGQMHRAPGGIMFGQNLIPDGSGAIAVGDPVELLEVGGSNLDMHGF